MFQTAIDVSRTEESFGWADKTESELRDIIRERVEYTKLDRALLNRIALALEDIATSLNPKKRKERATERQGQIRGRRIRRFRGIRTKTIQRRLAQWGDEHGQIPKRCRQRLYDGVESALWDIWSDFVDSTNEDPSLLSANMVEAAAACNLPDSLCRSGTKTETEYQAWKNGKPSENSTGKDS